MTKNQKQMALEDERAKDKRADTDRDRYWDEHMGTGAYRQGYGSSYTQNNYYNRNW